MRFAAITLAFATVAIVSGAILAIGWNHDNASMSDSRSSPRSGVPEKTAASPAATQPATRPTVSALLIDRREQLFAPALLRLTRSDSKVVARLYSDDPASVLSGKQIVNSYDLEMVLPGISDPAEISGAVWTSRAASSNRQETPYGIFLNSDRQVLQPMDVTVRFTGRPPTVNVFIKGTFWMYHADDTERAPMSVPVIGAVQAEVPAK